MRTKKEGKSITLLISHGGRSRKRYTLPHSATLNYGASQIACGELNADRDGSTVPIHFDIMVVLSPVPWVGRDCLFVFR
jgi:hypothetical protein